LIKIVRKECNMNVHLKYGTEGLDIEFPQTVNFKGVLYPEEAAVLDDPKGAIKRALASPIASPPLLKVAKGKKNAVIVISDITRPVPNPIILPPVIEQLEEAGISRRKITS
jgi:lactate racemase